MYFGTLGDGYSLYRAVKNSLWGTEGSFCFDIKNEAKIEPSFRLRFDIIAITNPLHGYSGRLVARTFKLIAATQCSFQ